MKQREKEKVDKLTGMIQLTLEEQNRFK